MSVNPSPQPFRGRASFRPVALDERARVEAARADLGPVRLDRIAPGRLAMAEEGEAIRLLFQLSGFSAVSRDRATVELAAGKWLAGPARSFDAAPVLGDAIALTLPGDHLSRPLLARLRTRPLSALPVKGAAHMCVELARSCLANRDQIGGTVAAALGESLAELAKLAIIDQLCSQRVETVRETVRTRIQAFVQRHLDDPGLSIDRIAERMECTKRYLHKVFSDEGQTLNQYIWAQRLERCRDDLGRAELADRSITQIAFACGFSNAAHFSRSFRARFGQTPRTYRRMALAGEQATAKLRAVR